MSGSVNKVILVGNLGADPEVRLIPNGQSVGNFSLATNEVFVGRDGERQERTDWHRVVVWGKAAEIAGHYLRKGRKVYVEGRLQTRQWKDQNEVVHYRTEVVCDQFQFLD